MSVPVIGDDRPTIPWVGWSSLSRTVNQLWDPENTPHHSVVALSGGGKSYLMVNGLLKNMCAYDRVLLIDTKGDDPTWSVKEKRKKGDQWWRLVVSDDPRAGRAQVSSALSTVYEEGGWVVVFDEIRDVTDPQSSRFRGLDLLGQVDLLYRKGRYRKVSIVAATQSPRWAPPAFYDQASFAWIGRIRDELRQKRLLEIGGLSKSELSYISTLKRREWLLSADAGELFARTKVD
jgi:hypothetical protein